MRVAYSAPVADNVPARRSSILGSGLSTSSPGYAKDNDDGFDFNQLLVSRPSATFVVTAVDGSNALGVSEGDWLIVEETARMIEGAYVVVIIDGEWHVKRFERIQSQPVLVSPDYAESLPILLSGGTAYDLKGVVMHVVRSLRSQRMRYAM